MEGRTGGKKRWIENGSDETAIRDGNEESDRLSVAQLKRVNVTAETVRRQSTVVRVCDRSVSNAVLRASKAGAGRARQADPEVRQLVE